MNKAPLFSLLALLGCWAMIYAGGMQSMVRVWHESKTFEHCFLIVPVVCWLFWQKRQALMQTEFQLSYWPVLLQVLPAMLWVVGQAAQIALFEHVALVMSLQLILWFWLGSARTKHVRFALFFLIFCIPFGEELVPMLQTITADLTVFFVRLSGIAIYREGLYLTIANGMFEVAEACSGIRFLISSIALGFLFAYLNFATRWKQVAFVLFCCLFPIIANGIRAYGIVLIGYLSDMRYATGADHLVYGWLFFSCVLLTLFYVAYQFADKAPDAPVGKTANLSATASPIQSLLTLCMLSIMLLQGWWITTISHGDALITQPIYLNKDYQSIGLSSWGITFPHAKQQVLARHSGTDIEVYVASAAIGFAGNDFINFNNRLYDNTHWSLVSQQVSKIDSNKQLAQLELVNLYGMSRSLSYWYCIEGYCNQSLSKIKLLESFYVLTNKKAEVILTAILAKTPADSAQQIALISQQLQAKEQVL